MTGLAGKAWPRSGSRLSGNRSGDSAFDLSEGGAGNLPAPVGNLPTGTEEDALRRFGVCFAGDRLH
jgi:hypothetical protein